MLALAAVLSDRRRCGVFRLDKPILEYGGKFFRAFFLETGKSCTETFGPNSSARFFAIRSVSRFCIVFSWSALLRSQCILTSGLARMKSISHSSVGMNGRRASITTTSPASERARQCIRRRVRTRICECFRLFSQSHSPAGPQDGRLFRVRLPDFSLKAKRN